MVLADIKGILFLEDKRMIQENNNVWEYITGILFWLFGVLKKSFAFFRVISQ